MKSTFAKILAASIVTTSSLSASAGSLICYSKVALLGLTPDGNLIVKLADQSGMVTDAHMICNVTTRGSYSATVETCKGWHETLIAARQINATVYIDYQVPAQITSCQAIPAWSQQYGTGALRY